jgi:hypothetical protein
MSRDLIDRHLLELLQPCRSLPHHEVVAALLSISQRGLDDGRYSRDLVAAGLELVVEALAARDFSASGLVALRTYLASLRMN